MCCPLHEQCEAGILSRPGKRDLADAAVGSTEQRRNPNVKVGGMTEKVCVVPDLPSRFTQSGRGAAMGTQEWAAMGKLDVNVHPLFLVGKIDSGYPPG